MLEKQDGVKKESKESHVQGSQYEEINLQRCE